MSSATACGHAASSCGGALTVHVSTSKCTSLGSLLGDRLCTPQALFVGRRKSLHRAGLTSSRLQVFRNGSVCILRGKGKTRLECMQFGRSGEWYVKSSIGQRRSRLHASTEGQEVQKSEVAEGGVPPDSNDGSVNEEQHAEEKSAGDSHENSHLRATAKRIAYQAKLLKYKGWIHDPAEADAHNNWVPVVRDKEQGLPLIAAIGLTVGSVVLALVLALQGWNRVRHRVPQVPRLPFISKWHPVAEPEVKKTKEIEPASTATEPSKEDQEKEHVNSDGKKATPPGKEGPQTESVSISKAHGANGAQSRVQVPVKKPEKGGSEPRDSEGQRRSEEQAKDRKDHGKRGRGNLFAALFNRGGKGEAEKGNSVESAELGAEEKSDGRGAEKQLNLESEQEGAGNVTKSATEGAETGKNRVAGGADVGRKVLAEGADVGKKVLTEGADVGKNIVEKGVEVAEGIKEKLGGDESESDASDKEAGNKQPSGQQERHVSDKESHSQRQERASESRPHSQLETHAPDGPSDRLPELEKRSDEVHRKQGGQNQESKENSTPLREQEEFQEQQGKAGRLETSMEGNSARPIGDEPAPVVLQPAVNVVALTGGDGRRAPPSSPTSAGGGGTPVVMEEEKGGVPAGILKAAADMLSGTELEELDQGEKLNQAVEGLKQKGVENEGEKNQVKSGVSEEWTAGGFGLGGEDDQADEGLSNPLKGIWPTVEFFEEGGEMEFGEGGVAKALGFPPLPIVPLQSNSSAKPEETAHASSTRDDERRPSLAGGEAAPVEDPPARGGPDAGAPTGGESFQDWYAKQWNGRGSSEGGSGGTEKRPPQGELKPSAYVDTAQLQSLQALQKLNVIDEDVQPSAVCTRRDFARWLQSGSRVLTGSPGVFPVPSEGVTETAFDDVTPEDRDFGAIQGLAEAGILPSRLSSSSTSNFQPDEPVTRQDVVRWKLALDRRRFPTETDAGKAVFDAWGFTDVDLIDADALPALVADFQAGDQSVIVRAFGYTLRFQPYKQVSVAQAAAALAAGSASETVAERVSEMEAYRAADEVFREEVREQREIIEAVAARGEEILKNLEEDKGTLADTRTAVEEAIKELDAHRDAIRRESEQLAQSVESARSIIEELTSVHTVSEAERNTLQAELQRLEDERVAVERVTSDAEAQIEAEVRRARAAVEGLEEVRETLKSEAEGRHLSAKPGGPYDKPLVEVFDDGMKAAGDRPRNILKRAMRAARTHLETAKGHLGRLRETTGGHVSNLRESTSGHVANLQSGSADVMATLKEKTGHVTEAGTEFVREIPDKAREVAHKTIPADVRDQIRHTSSVIWTRVREALLLAWQALVRAWHYVRAFLEVVVDRVKGGLERLQRKNHRSAA